jgi:perosamine synthetase
MTRGASERGGGAFRGGYAAQKRGGNAVRRKTLPYGRQTVDEDDIAAVVEVLRSDWLTTGPKVEEFERAFAKKVGAADAVTLASGTAALHAAMFALGVGKNDEVIVPAMTFAATANCVVYQGGTPLFADVDPETLLVDPYEVQKLLGPRTKAVITVDYAGQPCDYAALRDICRRHDVELLADACHALGASWEGRPVGALATLNAFSFHPVKHITTGEGGMVTTDDVELAHRIRHFRNHGITRDHRQRAEERSFSYEMVTLGFNYRLSDLQCALGLSQLKKLDGWVERRRKIAAAYDAAFAGREFVEPLHVRSDVQHAYHLYVIRLVDQVLIERKREVLAGLHAEGIGVNVHYPPVHLHPFYGERFGTKRGLCPNAEKAYEQIVSLPIFPTMRDSDVGDVVTRLTRVCKAFLE